MSRICEVTKIKWQFKQNNQKFDIMKKMSLEIVQNKNKIEISKTNQKMRRIKQ